MVNEVITIKNYSVTPLLFRTSPSQPGCGGADQNGVVNRLPKAGSCLPFCRTYFTVPLIGSPKIPPAQGANVPLHALIGWRLTRPRSVKEKSIT